MHRSDSHETYSHKKINTIYFKAIHIKIISHRNISQNCTIDLYQHDNMSYNITHSVTYVQKNQGIHITYHFSKETHKLRFNESAAIVLCDIPITCAGHHLFTTCNSQQFSYTSWNTWTCTASVCSANVPSPHIITMSTPVYSFTTNRQQGVFIKVDLDTPHSWHQM